MTDHFLQFFSDYRLDAANHQTLIAASAGVDSTVLCHLFHKASFPFAIAHCNFRLRGSESDGDEQFLKDLALTLNVPFFTTSFETETYAAQHKISLQMAARDLRYEWLSKIREESGFKWIATAHHADDNIETVLLNFTKGTGIAGMRGMPDKRDPIIRPLLPVSKKEILLFAKLEKIHYREDRSNATLKYTRNKIRHQVIPVLESINPSFQDASTRTIRHLNDVEALYRFAIEQIRDNVMEEITGENQSAHWKINIRKLHAYPATTTLLFELLAPFGFNGSQARQILQSIDNQPGSRFFSHDYVLLNDRSFLILKRQENIKGVNLISGINDSPVNLSDGKLVLEYLPGPPAGFTANPFTACMDYDSLSWPLILRRWKAGDVFQPLGMKGKHKKLQDYFSDRKLSRFEKERIWVLESNGQICWIIGMRMDERNKVTKSTKHCLLVTFLPNNVKL